MAIAFVSNLASFKRTLQYEKAKVRNQATKAYQKFVTMVLQDLSANTPQWSGDLAASWQVVVGESSGPNLGWKTGLKHSPWYVDNPFFKGDKPAVKLALAMNKPIIAAIKWNSIVSIVNASPTVKVVENTSRLRPDNYIEGDVMAVKTVAHKYAVRRKHLDLNLNTSGE